MNLIIFLHSQCPSQEPFLLLENGASNHSQTQKKQQEENFQVESESQQPEENLDGQREQEGEEALAKNFDSLVPLIVFVILDVYLIGEEVTNILTLVVEEVVVEVPLHGILSVLQDASNCPLA